MIRTLSILNDYLEDSVDAIYCINLTSRLDRWKKVCCEFEKIQIQDKVIRFAAIETPKNGAIGCMLSHRKIIQEAKEKGLKKILIFEDDIQILYPEKFIKQLVATKNEPFDMFYFGGLFLASNSYLLPYKKDIYRIHKGVFGAYAILISGNIFDFLLNILPNDGDFSRRRIDDFDQIYANVVQRYFLCLIPKDICIEQGVGYSNIALCNKGRIYFWWNRLGFFMASIKYLYYLKYLIFSLRFYVIESLRKYFHIKIKG